MAGVDFYGDPLRNITTENQFNLIVLLISVMPFQVSLSIDEESRWGERTKSLDKRQ